MQHVQQGYRGLSLFLGLNIDRLLVVLAIAMAMVAASLIHSV